MLTLEYSGVAFYVANDVRIKVWDMKGYVLLAYHKNFVELNIGGAM